LGHHAARKIFTKCRLFIFEQSIGHTQMTKPETPSGLFNECIWGSKIIHMAGTTGETSAKNSIPCLGTAKKSLSRVHLSHLFQSNFHGILMLLHTHADAVYFTVGRLAHRQASNLIIADLEITVIISSPLLQIYHCNTVSSFFDEEINFVQSHEFFIEWASGVACD
jgi:hypothetical protein